MTGDYFAAADGPKDRSRTLAWRNRRILAERLGWPDGTVATCEAAELAFPGWSVAWIGENTTPGFEHPAGFWATLDGMHKVELLAADRQELIMRLAQGVPPHDYSVTGCAWCLSHLGNRRVRL